jgi:hypothetical protein
LLLVTGCALVLHLLWLRFLGGTGGDLPAQDAWTSFAVAHPESAYNLSWYGGMHPASYSLISPYLMGVVGVRAAMLVAGTLSVALVAVLINRSAATMRTPTWAGLYAAVALMGNALAGRVTFAVGVALGLACLTVVFAWPGSRRGRPQQWLRGGLAALLAGLATAASPVAGLFLGLLAVALWLRARRRVALVVGAPPLVVVGATALLFPFAGIQPFPIGNAVVPLVLAGVTWVLLPREWHLVRMCCAVYGVAVLVVWLVPTPVGTNVARLSLLFGGVTLVAAASGPWWTSPVALRWGRPVARLALAVAIAASSGWQVFVAGQDVIGSSAASTLDADVRPLVAQLDARGAALGRVEVVPTESHGEASALAPFVNLARGWNRQADVARHPMFYRDGAPFGSQDYRRWLRRWAVRFVVLSTSTPDYAGLRESHLVREGLPYLRRVWSDPTWTLYEVSNPMSIASAPATVLDWDAADVTVQVPVAGSTVLRIAWSPWLSVVDEDGQRLDDAALAGSCLAPLPRRASRGVSWVVLRAAHPGTYRIAAPYTLPRGSACPD